MTNGICGDFLCKYNIDDDCNDCTFCSGCLLFDCEDCVYAIVDECGEIFCSLSDGCGCGQTFSP